MSKTVLAFDLYGTLLSTESIAKQLSAHFGQEKAASVAATWRKYQLEYTWRFNSMSMAPGFLASWLPGFLAMGLHH
jgi:2-haloacid dehalogenase